MRNASRSRPDSSPPAAGPVLRRTLLIAGAVLILLALVALATVATPTQALALAIVGLSLGAFSIGTGHEFEPPVGWPRRLQRWPHHSRGSVNAPKNALRTPGSVRTRSIEVSARRDARDPELIQKRLREYP